MAKGQTFVEGIAKILVELDVITHQEAQGFKKGFKNSAKAQFDDFLLEEGLIQKKDLLMALSQYYKVPSFDVNGYFFYHNLLRKFPKDFLIRNAIIPLAVEGDMLVMVASDPSISGLESKVRKYVSWDINFMVGIKQEIWNQISSYYDESIAALPQDVEAIKRRDYQKASDILGEEELDLEDKIENIRQEKRADED